MYKIGDRVRILDEETVENLWPVEEIRDYATFTCDFDEFYFGIDPNLLHWDRDDGNSYFCGLVGTIISMEDFTSHEIPDPDVREILTLYNVVIDDNLPFVEPFEVEVAFFSSEFTLAEPIVKPTRNNLDFNEKLL